jgi:hypothetical protein
MIVPARWGRSHGRRKNQDIVGLHGSHHLGQATVELLQRPGVTGNIAPMAVAGVEIDEIGHDDGALLRVAHGGQRGIPDLVETGGLVLFGDADMGVDISNLADGHHLPASFGQLLQHGGGRRRQGQILAVAGTHKAPLPSPQTAGR